MNNFSAIDRLLSERFTAYVKIEEVLEWKQNHKTTLKLAYTEQANAHVKAEAALRRVESLNAELELLPTSESLRNYEPAVINLVERLKPHIATNSSVQNFDKDVHAATKIANELGLFPPKHEVFGLAVWLQNTVASWISKSKTALGYANNVATEMTDANLVVQ